MASAALTRRRLGTALLGLAIAATVSSLSANGGGGSGYRWRNVEIVGGGYV